MIEVIQSSGSGFTKAYISDGWQVCFATKGEQYGELKIMKRHNDTDEGFVLLQGEAELYCMEEGNLSTFNMKPGCLYLIHRGTWHHLYIKTNETLLLAVEDDKTSSEHTERMEMYDHIG